MTLEELTTIVEWVTEHWSDDHGWRSTRLADWVRTPPEAVWEHLVAHAEDEAAPTPGETREATRDAQTPLDNTWEAWRHHFGYEDLTVDEAVIQRHRDVFPRWTSECRCFVSSDQFAASEHVACHVPHCDLHEDAA